MVGRESLRERGTGQETNQGSNRHVAEDDPSYEGLSGKVPRYHQ